MKRLLLAAVALLLIFACWLVLTPMPAGIPILEYHMVDEAPAEDERVYNVPPEEFREQLDYLQQQGYTTITMLDYAKARKGKFDLPAKPVILTFDDGYEDNYTTVLPLLEERGMKATVFMVTNFIGEPTYLDWDELRAMQVHGIEIGSHTANHQPLTEMTLAESREEVHLSKLLLEWNGIHTVFAFSYPNGKYNSELAQLLQDEDYLAAVTGDAGVNNGHTDPYLLQRINIPHPRFGLVEFRLRLLKAQLFTRLGIQQHDRD